MHAINDVEQVKLVDQKVSLQAYRKEKPTRLRKLKMRLLQTLMSRGRMIGGSDIANFRVHTAGLCITYITGLHFMKPTDFTLRKNYHETFH